MLFIKGKYSKLILMADNVSFENNGNITKKRANFKVLKSQKPQNSDSEMNIVVFFND